MGTHKILAVSAQLIFTTISFAQCPYDTCDDPFVLNIIDQGYYCAPEIVQANTFVIADSTIVVINHNCNDENGGNSSCWTDDHDYWIRLNIASDGLYTFNITSDYINYNLAGGVHFAVYQNVCGNLIETFNPYCPNSPQIQNLIATTYLYAGSYLIQVDGFGTSGGTSQMCVMFEQLLGLNVDEILQDIEPGTNWKMHIVRKYYLRR